MVGRSGGGVARPAAELGPPVGDHEERLAALAFRSEHHDAVAVGGDVEEHLVGGDAPAGARVREERRRVPNVSDSPRATGTAAIENPVVRKNSSRPPRVQTGCCPPWVVTWYLTFASGKDTT